MRYLTIEQRERLQEDLQALAARLRAEIEQQRRLPNHSEETDDDAVADLAGDLDIAELERDVRELQATEAALVRLHHPDYGLCDDCGAEIPFARLAAMPTATRCIACQGQRERRTGTDSTARL